MPEVEITTALMMDYLRWTYGKVTEATSDTQRDDLIDLFMRSRKAAG